VTKQNVIVRICKSEAKVTNNKKYCAACIVLLKLTTDRRKTSRGLSATAELLIFDSCQCVSNFRFRMLLLALYSLALSTAVRFRDGSGFAYKAATVSEWLQLRHRLTAAALTSKPLRNSQ